jgi:hypothetical protein
VEIAPLDPLVRCEGWLVDPKPEASNPWQWNSSSGYDQYVDKRPTQDLTQDACEVASDYLACGLLDDAFNVLEATLSSITRPDPLAIYTLGYIENLRGNEVVAHQKWDLAAQHNGTYSFSFRREDVRMLESVLSYNPKDGLAQTLLGMLYMYQRNYATAVLHLEQAAALRPDGGQPARLLAICFREQQDTGQAIQHLWQAVKAGPENPGFYVELDELLASLPDTSPERMRLWINPSAAVLADDNARGRYAFALADDGRYEQALQVLASHIFFPEEGSSLFRDLFSKIHLLQALTAWDKGNLDDALQHARMASTYPDNLGLATPFICYDSPAFILEAAIEWRRGNRNGALTLLERAANERHRETNEAEYFSALAIKYQTKVGDRPNSLESNNDVQKKLLAIVAKATDDLEWPDRDHNFARFLICLGKAGAENRYLSSIRLSDLSLEFQKRMILYSQIAGTLGVFEESGR